MAKPNSTPIRVSKDTNRRLIAALKSAQNGLSITEFAETILKQALDQIEREKVPPGPLPIVETIRRQRGLGVADGLRTLLENRDELQSLVREEVKNALEDFGEKYAKMVEGTSPGKRKARA